MNCNASLQPEPFSDYGQFLEPFQKIVQIRLKTLQGPGNARTLTSSDSPSDGQLKQIHPHPYAKNQQSAGQRLETPPTLRPRGVLFGPALILLRMCPALHPNRREVCIMPTAKEFGGCKDAPNNWANECPSQICFVLEQRNHNSHRLLPRIWNSVITKESTINRSPIGLLSRLGFDGL